MLPPDAATCGGTMQYGSRPTSSQQLATRSRIAESSVTLAVFSKKWADGNLQDYSPESKGGHRGRRDLGATISRP